MALGKTVRVFAPAAAVFVNKDFLVGLRSKEEATRCISQLLKDYGPGETAIRGQVEIREVNLEASARLPVKDAVRVLKSPAVPETHKVQTGDTAWKIAADEGISVDTLKRLNPSVNLEALKPGMVIKVSEAKPRLTVMTKREVSRIEPIPYEIQILPMARLPKGERKVVHKGETGEKRIVEEVTLANGREVARRTLSAKTEKKPVNEVVWVGKAAP